jgi:hypothetical protein
VQACKGTERRKIPPSFEAAEKKDNLKLHRACGVQRDWREKKRRHAKTRES